MNKFVRSAEMFMTFLKDNNRKQLKTSSAKTRIAIQYLKALGKNIAENLPDEIANKYSVQLSKGVGYFPANPWIALAEKGKKASNSSVVFFCFGGVGEGFVMGATLPNIAKDDFINSMCRDTLNDNLVDIGSYNNIYVNRKDFLSGQLSDLDIKDHFVESVKVLEALQTKIII